MASFVSEALLELNRRGLIKDCSDLQGLDEILASGRQIAVYAGFDPTAASLHVGHLATLTVLKAFARHGHEILPVLGTGTAMIGDPTGRTTARKMLSIDDVVRNADGISKSIGLVLGGLPAQILSNGEWIGKADLVWFLREVGSRIPLSKLLAQESVKTRLGDTGISFLEACYPLLQAWDFWHLSSSRPALLQVGGSDQFGNICMGLELIGRSDGDARKTFGLTHPLLTKANGEKMGKTGDGAVWLNPEFLDAFGFYRFWRTLPDAAAPRIARMLSDMHPENIAAAEREGGMAVDRLKSDLAFIMTKSIRGRESALSAQAASRSRGVVADGLPTLDVSLEDALDLPGLLVKTGLASSKGAARRLAVQGGLRVNGKPRLTPVLTEHDTKGGVIVLSAGKTQHRAVRVNAAATLKIQPDANP